MREPSVKQVLAEEAQIRFQDVQFKSLDLPEQSEVAHILKNRYKFTRQQIADFMGLTHRTVMTRLHTYKLYAAEGRIPSGHFAEGAGEEAPLQSVLLDEVERQNRSAATKLSNIFLRGDILEQRLIAAMAPQLPTPADIKAVEALYKSAKRSKFKTNPKSEEMAMATISDLHLGLDTAQHPYKKAIEANDNYVRRVIKLTDLHRANFRVKTIHLNLLGDLIQGSSANYPSQRWDTTIPAAIQIERATEVYVRTIETFLIDFDEVIVNCSPGNHGNLAKDQTDPGNWETIMHRSLRWAFRDNKRVKFNIEEDDFFQVVDVMGVKFLLMHGHALKGGAFEQLITSFRKYADILPAFRYAIIGHFHRFARLPLPRQHGSTAERTLYLNGTAAERDDHIEKSGGSPTPLYWLFFVEPKGITSEAAVRLYE